MHDEYVNLEGLKGVFTKDTKGLMGCKFEGGHEGIASQFDLQLCFYLCRFLRLWIGIKVRRVLNKSLVFAARKREQGKRNLQYVKIGTEYLSLV